MSATSTSYGANIAFIEELLEKYKQNPSSVSASWQEFFQDYEPGSGDDDPAAQVPAPSAVVQPRVASWTASPRPASEAVVNDPEASSESAPAPSAPPTQAAVPAAPLPVEAAPAAAPSIDSGSVPREPAPPSNAITVPLRGAFSKIAKNMETSLTMPTATSVRNIPVKALEENRRVINHHLAMMGQSKTSFTHVIAWAIVKALAVFPKMNAAFTSVDGEPARIDRQNVNLGIAIDVEKKDGTRSLLVPNIRQAEKLDFSQFLKAYGDIVRKARNNTLGIADFEGTTISLTNPGTLGTVASIPRLMQSQGAIIATGQIDYPAEYSATDEEVLADLGISKVMTITSTYDHRIIQGAESGSFLAKIHSLLLGAENFYDEIYRDLRIPYEPVYWSKDQNRSLLGRERSGSSVLREAGVLQMINAYRVRGHLLANLDPLEYRVGRHPELSPNYYGLTIWDLDREFSCGGLCGEASSKLRDILDTLRETYCGRLGPEYMHMQDPVQKRWLQDRMEPLRNSAPLDGALKRRILVKLNDAESFEKFLHTKYVGHKRFSLEGAEVVIPMLDHLLNEAAREGVREVVFGMAHRGRLNVLANILSKSYEKIFHEFEGDIDPTTTQGSGDVKYHLGADGVHTTPTGTTVILTLASNPSHLEAVDPIVEGITRAKQKLLNDRNRSKVLPVLLHGDAAFAGQGVVAETLNLSQLRGYKTGGTLHIVVNNQIGFTTSPEDARSSVYATDVAKMVQAPIFHVNGDDPEACVRAVQLAFDFRHQFHRDVVIDVICYRRHGHNEGDEPSLTQPRMYKMIKEHRSVRKLYTESLLRKGDIDPKEAEDWLENFQRKLQEAFDRTREESFPPPKGEPLYTDEEITGLQNQPSIETGITRETLEQVGTALTSVPPGFTLHAKLRPVIARRSAMLKGEEPVDWALAELLAFGSLLVDGHRVRLSGQDSGRGTFSHRHAILFDHNSGKGFVPLNRLAKNHPKSREQWADAGAPVEADRPDEAPVNFSVYDSLLSEYGVLGFEYGYTVADKGALVLWEAQFGDFMNGAQIIVDQFISSAEEKWGQHSGIVLLLPHGYEGQGPEHSSARLERFLTLCAEGNMQVVNVTTPAQYFHVLRRQMRNDPRKPLIVMTPKSLLRHPLALSPMEELLTGRFHPVLDDLRFRDGNAEKVSRIVLSAGKVSYDLLAARQASGKEDVALLRLEQFYPWPQGLLSGALARYPNATEVVWAQEEPRNMGGWPFVHEKIQLLLKSGQKLRYVGRPISASPATGSHRRHEEQQRALVDLAIRS